MKEIIYKTEVENDNVLIGVYKLTEMLSPEDLEEKLSCNSNALLINFLHDRLKMLNEADKWEKNDSKKIRIYAQIELCNLILKEFK